MSAKRFSAILVGLILLSLSAQDTLFQFRTPDVGPEILAGETIDDSNKPVSFFYVDYYGGSTAVPDCPQLLQLNPCVMMEPAYTLVRDKMTFYGTCNYDKMFQLKIIRSNGTWTAAVQLSANYSMNFVANDFELSWQGINHTVILNKRNYVFGLILVQLLVHKQMENVQDVRSIYPELVRWPGRLPDENCQCLDGSRFNYRKTWLKLSHNTNKSEKLRPETSKSEQISRPFWVCQIGLVVLIISGMAVILVIRHKNNKPNKIGAVSPNEKD